MKKTKKTIAILLIIAILFPFMPSINSIAAEEAQDFTDKFTIALVGKTEASKEAEIGEKVSVEINLKNGLSGKNMLGMAIQYDNTKLQIEDEEQDIILHDDVKGKGTEAVSMLDEEKGNIAISFGAKNPNNTSAVVGTQGKIATINFKVIAGGKSEIKFKENTIKYELGNEASEVVRANSTSKVSVIGRIHLTGIKIANKENVEATTLNKGETLTLSCTKQPLDTTDKTQVVWSSTNTSVITVDSSTGVVTGVSKGTATIKAKCGTYEDTCQITVVNPPVQSISLNNATIDINKTKKLEIIKNPVGADIVGNITWTSDNSEIATVGENGVVTAHKIRNSTNYSNIGRRKNSNSNNYSSITNHRNKYK